MQRISWILVIALLLGGLGYLGLRRDRQRTAADTAETVAVGGGEEQSDPPDDWDNAIFQVKQPVSASFSPSWLETIDLLETHHPSSANSDSVAAYNPPVPAFMPPCIEPESSLPARMPYATAADEQAHRLAQPPLSPR